MWIKWWFDHRFLAEKKWGWFCLPPPTAVILQLLLLQHALLLLCHPWCHCWSWCQSQSFCRVGTGCRMGNGRIRQFPTCIPALPSYPAPIVAAPGAQVSLSHPSLHYWHFCSRDAAIWACKVTQNSALKVLANRTSQKDILAGIHTECARTLGKNIKASDYKTQIHYMNTFPRYTKSHGSWIYWQNKEITIF